MIVLFTKKIILIKKMKKLTFNMKNNKLKVLGSSSRGNCYFLQCADEKEKNSILVLEAGITPKEVLKSINYEIESIKGVLVTHEHLDHAKYIKEWIKLSVCVYVSKGTKEALKLEDHHNIRYLKAFEKTQIDEFSILPFDTIHDCKESIGFIISHKQIGNILFATDLNYLKYKFNNLNHILIEANHDIEKLKESESFHKMRTIHTHMSIDTTEKYLRSSDLSKVKNIMLLHLSDSHSDKDIFLERAERINKDINYYIAEKNLEINL